MSKSVVFNGIPSGDYESFCWDVSYETFVKITGKKPKSYNKSYFNKDKYRIYPSEFFSNNNECEIMIKVKE